MAYITERKRTLVSALTYRAVSTVLLAGISYGFTGKLTTSIEVTITFAISATVLFYINERTWERTAWGRRKVSPQP